MNEQLTLKVLDALDSMSQRIKMIETDMVRKSDIADMVVKSDIADMVRKSDIADMVRKSDIADMVRKSDIADLPLIRQAVLETAAAVKRIEAKLEQHQEILDSHSHSIDILHRNQLRIETEIEKIRSK
ncbi:hypothetical protein [Ferviditalea candida]|uniref:Uncharacterized protein n=1 Tax=Ferviditalea candida TaxID=3108399 RepID=A0ABU5ZIJ5_9BACL|nr:hypothetical protein [Paenibacillaceae bacterium T2]